MSKDLTKKSGIIYLSVFLFLVCAVATALMSFAAVMTDKPIADRQKALIAGTLKRVLPPFETVTEQKAENGSTVYTALDAGGKTVGYAVLCTTLQGYAGRVEALVGFSADHSIWNIVVTSHNETPGIGTRVMDRERVKTISDVVRGKEEDPSLPPNAVLDSYKGKKRTDVLSRETVHFISGATVSSNAVFDLVLTARNILGKTIGVKGK